MQEKHGKAIESHDDFRHLYVDALRDNSKKLTAEEASKIADRGWTSTSKVEFDTVALELKYIYDVFGYDTALRVAQIAARFEDDGDFEMQSRIVEMFGDIAESNKQVMLNILGRLEKMFESIEEKSAVIDEIGRFYYMAYGDSAAVIFFGEPNRYLIFGDRNELRGLAEGAKDEILGYVEKDEGDEQIIEGLDSLMRILDRTEQEDLMDRASKGISKELDGSVEEIIKNLKAQGGR